MFWIVTAVVFTLVVALCVLAMARRHRGAGGVTLDQQPARGAAQAHAHRHGLNQNTGGGF